jgi:hypothetical protein
MQPGDHRTRAGTMIPWLHAWLMPHDLATEPNGKEPGESAESSGRIF